MGITGKFHFMGKQGTSCFIRESRHQETLRRPIGSVLKNMCGGWSTANVFHQLLVLVHLYVLIFILTFITFFSKKNNVT